jgi:hypothetical protein
MDRDEISILYRGPSIDASYQVSVHLAEGFQRRRLKCEKLTDNRRQTQSDGKSSHCLWQSELKSYISVSDSIQQTFIQSMQFEEFNFSLFMTLNYISVDFLFKVLQKIMHFVLFLKSPFYLLVTKFERLSE